MSYILEKFDEGEVHIENNVCGWKFDSGEFRPLMQDAMTELLEAGFITNSHVAATMVARTAHEKATLEAYAKNEEAFWRSTDNVEAQGERLFEMKAAFGEGAEVVNVFTGRKHIL